MQQSQPQASISPSLPPKQQNNYIQPQQNIPKDNHKGGVSFLIPISKIKTSEY